MQRRLGSASRARPATAATKPRPSQTSVVRFAAGDTPAELSQRDRVRAPMAYDRRRVPMASEHRPPAGDCPRYEGTTLNMPYSAHRIKSAMRATFMKLTPPPIGRWACIRSTRLFCLI
jgi:hypothetical protein